MTLHVQIFHRSKWHDAATLSFSKLEAGRGSAAQLEYDQAYAVEWLGRDGLEACGLLLPVDLIRVYRGNRWFGFLDDIMPAGASRRYWVEKLGLTHLPELQQDYELLRNGSVAPVGNIRVKESLPDLPSDSQLFNIRFSKGDVVERHSEFLEYAQEMGAASGGATGAGGEAPKLLLRASSAGDVWIDTFQEDQRNLDTHYLVKFPRANRTQDDCDILRTEYHYYQELAGLGVSTIDTRLMHLIEGSRYPSLWLPRFDVAVDCGEIVRYGLESVYSILNLSPGSDLNHFNTLRYLAGLLTNQHSVSELHGQFNAEAFAIEWVKRDLLNVVFGNSDNHGRNTLILKTAEGAALAPIFDFAPMKADPEGIIRTTRWGPPFEQGGNFDWHAIAHELADLVEPELLLEELRTLGRQLLGLRERLADRGVPERILAKPVLGLDFLDKRLQQWDLL